MITIPCILLFLVMGSSEKDMAPTLTLVLSSCYSFSSVLGGLSPRTVLT